MNYTKLSNIAFQAGGYPIVLQSINGWDITIDWEPVLYEYILADGTRNSIIAGYYATITCTISTSNSAQHGYAKQIANLKTMPITSSSPVNLGGSNAYIVAFSQEVITSTFVTSTIKLKCTTLFPTIP